MTKMHLDHLDQSSIYSILVHTFFLQFDDLKPYLLYDVLCSVFFRVECTLESVVKLSFSVCSSLLTQLFTGEMGETVINKYYRKGNLELSSASQKTPFHFITIFRPIFTHY